MQPSQITVIILVCILAVVGIVKGVEFTNRHKPKSRHTPRTVMDAARPSATARCPYGYTYSCGLYPYANCIEICKSKPRRHKRS